MVWFDCACGESVKKPQVAKHMLHCWQCLFTCVDCKQQFNSETYVAHTSCMSEAQRFQGKLWDPESEKKSNKGAARQESFVELVHAAADNVTGPMKQHLLRLRDYNNIPRKQKPFGNFVKNSLNLRSAAEVEQLWTIVQKATAPQVSPAKSPKVDLAKSAKIPPGKSPKVLAAASPKTAPIAGTKRPRPTDDEIIQEEIRTALSIAGGRLKWRKLRDQVVPKLVARGFKGDLGERVVASIPDAFCNDVDPYVRMKA